MPGVGDTQHAGDGPLAVNHQAMDLAEHVADLTEVVFGREPGAGKETVVVGTALAVDEHELDGWGGGELAELVGDEHRLAKPGQTGDDDAGDLSHADGDQSAVLGPPKPP